MEAVPENAHSVMFPVVIGSELTRPDLVFVIVPSALALPTVESDATMNTTSMDPSKREFGNLFKNQPPPADGDPRVFLRTTIDSVVTLSEYAHNKLENGYAVSLL